MVSRRDAFFPGFPIGGADCEDQRGIPPSAAELEAAGSHRPLGHAVKVVAGWSNTSTDFAGGSNGWLVDDEFGWLIDGWG